MLLIAKQVIAKPRADYSDWGFLGLLGQGEVFAPSLLNYENIQTMTTKLKGEIVHGKCFL